MTRGPIAAGVAQNMQRASWIRAMFEKGRAIKARLGEDRVFDFSLGNPDAIPPTEFMDAVVAVAQERAGGLHRYMPNAGFDETRAAIAAFVAREYHISLDAGGLVVTCGAAGGLNVVFRALCDPGDEVIVLAPFFPEYRSYIEQAGGTMVTVDTDAHFQPDLSRIQSALTTRTRAILVNSPNNPTGAVYSEAICQGLADLLAKHDRPDQPLYLVTDDPYHRLTYDRQGCPTVVGRYARCIIVSSYSKDLSIAGERIGYVAAPSGTPDRESLVGAFTMLNRTLGYVNAPAFMQRVVARCADALCDVSEYRRKRDLLCRVLAEAGYSLQVPAGGMFVFPRTPMADDVRFVDLLLAQNILAVPGQGFGRAGHIRLSLAVPRETIERAAAGFAAAFRAATE